MGNNKLTGGVDGVRGEVEGSGVETMPGRHRRVGLPGTHGVEGKEAQFGEVSQASGWKGKRYGRRLRQR